LYRLDGTSTALTRRLDLAAYGHTAAFLNQIPGFETLDTPFQGVLRVTSSSLISVTALRGRYHERGDFLITTLPPLDEGAAPSNSPIFFPHIVDSDGYTTQLILINSGPGSSASGEIRFLSHDGRPLNLAFE
jgi:hypothetical protein